MAFQIKLVFNGAKKLLKISFAVTRLYLQHKYQSTCHARSVKEKNTTGYNTTSGWTDQPHNHAHPRPKLAV